MKKLATVLMTSLLGFGLFSCASSNNEFKPRYDTTKEYQVNVVGHYSNFEALEAEIVRFNEYYPNAEINYTRLDDYNDVIMTALSSENAPDIFFTYPWWIEDTKYSELFSCTEDLLKVDGINLSIIREGLVYKKGEEMPMVPIYATTYGMMVNEDLFTKENISIPNSYNELITACQSFKDKGYQNVMMGHTSMIMYPMYFPHVCYKIKDNKTAITELNNLNSSAGEYLRDSLNLVSDFMGKGFINLDNCKAIKDDYEETVKRFFQGDVPMMLSKGQTVSATKKGERKYEQFSVNPFKYSFRPVPMLDNGGVFYNSVNLCFSVNKNSENVNMANEFMRFLISNEELGNMAKIKRLLTPTKDLSFDNIYSSFSNAYPIYASNLGLNDTADQKIRNAGSKVAQGKSSIEDAIANWAA